MDTLGLSARRRMRYGFISLTILCIYAVHTTILTTGWGGVGGIAGLSSADEEDSFISWMLAGSLRPGAEIPVKLRVRRTAKDEEDIPDEPVSSLHPLFKDKEKIIKQQPRLHAHLQKQQRVNSFKEVYPYLVPFVPKGPKPNKTLQCRRFKVIGDVPTMCVLDNKAPSDLFDDFRNGFHDNLPIIAFFMKALRMYKQAGVIDIGGPVSIFALLANFLRHQSVVIAPLMATFTEFYVMKQAHPYNQSIFSFHQIMDRKRQILHVEEEIEYDSLYNVISPSDGRYQKSLPVSTIRFKDVRFLAPFKETILCVDMRGCNLESLMDIPILLDKMDIIAFIFDWTRLRDIRLFEPKKVDAIAEDLVDQLESRGFEPLVIKELKVDDANAWEKNIVWMKTRKYPNVTEIFKKEVTKPQQKFDWINFIQ